MHLDDIFRADSIWESGKASLVLSTPAREVALGSIIFDTLSTSHNDLGATK